MKKATFLCAAFVVTFVLASVFSAFCFGSDIPTLRLKHVATYQHDSRAFTQGLLYAAGTLYESTGIYGESSLRETEIETGKVLRRVLIPRGIFGEGLSLVGDELYQISWQSGVCLVYAKETLREVRRLRYRGEGWGLTFDGTSLWMSDGSATLQRRDPKTFDVIGTLTVTDGQRRVSELNELEWVDGELWSNVFGDLRIARINPTTGQVLGWIDMAAFLPRDITRSEATLERHRVLNGIAYDPATRRLFVTGKLWSELHIFEIIRAEQTLPSP